MRFVNKIILITAFSALINPIRAVGAEKTSLYHKESSACAHDSRSNGEYDTATTPDDRRKRNGHSAGKGKNAADDIPDIMPRQARHDKPIRTDGPNFLGVKQSGSDNFHYNGSKEGIDVSHYQGRIDWEKVAKNGGISYVYAKATEGASFYDNTHKYNITNARKYGLKVGSYHYYRPNVDIHVQLANMTSHVLKEDQDLVPMIDIEEDRGVTESKFIADLTAFIHLVEKHYGKKPLLYSGEYFYNRHFQGLFLDYEWMMARYSSTAPRLKDGKSYFMWQYSDKGRIPGIPVLVDRSCMIGEVNLKVLAM